MAGYFLYGTLRHEPLLEVVLGRPAAPCPAWLADHASYWVQGQSFPTILPEPGACAEGLFLEDVSPEEAARLDAYEAGYGYATRSVTVTLAAGGSRTAKVFFPEPGRWTPGAPFRLEDWARRWGDVVVEAARDVMQALTLRSPEKVLARYPQLLDRAGSRLRARAGGPTSLRRATGPDDLHIAAFREPYARYFAVEEADIAFRGFLGGMLGPVTRAAFVLSDAVTVLPYDPVRDRVLIVEQFRMGPFARGDSQPWTIETIAGRVDGGETPEDAARREAQEEAGLELHDLLPVAQYYPSPGAVSEYIYSFIALCDLPDSSAGLGGVESETEDIRAHVVSFDRLMALISSGEITGGPLILTAYWLAGRRESLRRDA